MSDTVITVDALSKAYKIGLRERQGRTFREMATDALFSPFRRARSLLTTGHSPLATADDTFWALKDVSFEVKRGEVVGIIGRNGAGKSTLLKILSRITEPTAGTVRLRGRVASLLEVGTGFHPELTGRENVYLNGAILGMKRAEITRKFDEIVAFAEVEKFLDTPVKFYSSGMYVRLAFAVAAHLEPEILIVDEVLAVGDAEFQKKCLGKMQDVSKGDGRTVLFVSHNMAAVRTLCCKSLVLARGALVHIGDVAAGLDLYQGSQTASGTRILDRITYAQPSFRVTRIRVNGVDDGPIYLGSGERKLSVELEGQIAESLRADIELTLMDTYDVPLAFFSAAHERGITTLYPAGALRLSVSVLLPERIHRGRYYLSIDVAEANVRHHVQIPRAVSLETEGAPTATGRPLEYSERKGLFSFESAQS